jgi:hypothetical protein
VKIQCPGVFPVEQTFPYMDFQSCGLEPYLRRSRKRQVEKLKKAWSMML